MLKLLHPMVSSLPTVVKHCLKCKNKKTTLPFFWIFISVFRGVGGGDGDVELPILNNRNKIYFGLYCTKHMLCTAINLCWLRTFVSI